MHRHICKQNMVHITQVTSKYPHFLGKLHLAVNIPKNSVEKVTVAWMHLRYSSQRKWRFTLRKKKKSLLHDEYLLITIVTITYDNLPSVIKLIYPICVLLFFALSFWHRKKWKFSLVVKDTGKIQKTPGIIAVSGKL